MQVIKGLLNRKVKSDQIAWLQKEIVGQKVFVQGQFSLTEQLGELLEERLIGLELANTVFFIIFLSIFIFLSLDLSRLLALKKIVIYG